MKPQITIRRARPTDLPAIYLGELDYIRQIEPQHEARWKEAVPLHLKQWTAGLDLMFVAESENQIAGYCFWEIRGDDAVLASLYVAPDRRREGIGRTLLMRFIEDAKNHHIRIATLGVQADNPARFLYEKTGFVRTHDAYGFLHYRYAFAPD